MKMALSLVKNQPAAQQPHRQALRDNLKAIRDTRARKMVIVERDRKAAADQALCDATQQQIASVQQEIDTLRADAAYANQPAPDTRAQENKIQALQQLLKKQSDVARAATLIRAKYSADIQKLNEELSAHAAKTDRLTWIAAYEGELSTLAAEYLQAEAAFLDVRRRVFSAAALCDAFAREHSYGEFVGAGLGADFRIPRPVHAAYADNLTPEQSYAERNQYALAIAAGAQALVRELRGSEQD
jgi:chromosome segregation ATPase